MSIKSNDLADDFEKEIQKIFFQEAKINLEEAEKIFLALNEISPIDLIEHSFRLAHNLKGSAKAVGFSEVSNFIHHLEGVLLLLKKRTIKATSEISNLLLTCNDQIKIIIEKLKENNQYKGDYTNLIDKINIIKLEAEKNLSDSNEKKDKITQQEDEIVFLNKEPDEREIDQNTNKKQKKDHTDEIIRVPLNKVEKLQNYIDEMIILEGMLSEEIKAKDSLKLKNNFRQLVKITKEFQDIIINLRMVPIMPVFQKLLRTARDTSAQLNKKVNIEFFGENTEFDKFILDQISDPLMHMVRNAIDHGIESEEERKEKGKSIEGYISVIASHESGDLVLSIKDNGRGLDPKILQEQAIQKGIILQNQILDEEQSYNLIFSSGFSTKVEATDISGRGVGMDVVRTNVRALNGTIKISSTIDVGTEFNVRIPLSIGIMEAFIVEIEKEKYVIPIQHVRESISLQKCNLKHIHNIGDICILRNEEIPIYHLGNGLKVPNYKDNNLEKILLIIQNKEKKVGIVVDNISTIQSVVTKPLGEELRCESGIVGGVILGNGKAIPILEAETLIENRYFKNNINSFTRRI